MKVSLASALGTCFGVKDAIDLAMDPESPNILYAAAYQRRRTAFGFSGGGPGSGMFRTTDGMVAEFRMRIDGTRANR